MIDLNKEIMNGAKVIRAPFGGKPFIRYRKFVPYFRLLRTNFLFFILFEKFEIQNIFFVCLTLNIFRIALEIKIPITPFTRNKTLRFPKFKKPLFQIKEPNEHNENYPML